MLGKNKCRILKEIRQKIADENDIPYVTRECTYQGECSGTCPRCEQELRYLEQQLAQRQRLGKKVAVTALCASLALTVSGCSSAGLGLLEQLLPGPPTETAAPLEGAIEILDGEVEFDPGDEPGDEADTVVDIEDDLMGEVPYEEEDRCADE